MSRAPATSDTSSLWTSCMQSLQVFERLPAKPFHLAINATLLQVYQNSTKTISSTLHTLSLPSREHLQPSLRLHNLWLVSKTQIVFVPKNSLGECKYQTQEMSAETVL